MIYGSSYQHEIAQNPPIKTFGLQKEVARGDDPIDNKLISGLLPVFDLILWTLLLLCLPSPITSPNACLSFSVGFYFIKTTKLHSVSMCWPLGRILNGTLMLRTVNNTKKSRFSDWICNWKAFWQSEPLIGRQQQPVWIRGDTSADGCIKLPASWSGWTDLKWFLSGRRVNQDKLPLWCMPSDSLLFCF